ncbi:MAG TPA: helix-turn-helix transcriptional regulator [Stackebrandtia sp.]|jgi:DNA-binding transcriptional ArsR family regulator|uniref:ArsR/SmtB family transcription factor n=1 Tax=Stackebrandtia sp. TaxID=2023065 RepID=UPI002D47660C|nr:helix-turn-helix transcriptional regulator [Stackebrandtia sp.]HZE40440.1 helix-turn-helix transcriptional regulator [Stackebrandtia sp.]
MRELPHPPRDEIELAAVMQALADPVRLELVRLMDSDAAAPCAALAESVGVHKSTASHHFRTLRESGVTTTIVDGRIRFVRLRREALQERFPGLLDAVLRAAHANSPVSSRP